MNTNTDLSSDTDNSFSSSSNNNFNNGNLAINSNNSTKSRFATIQSSPSLEDFTNTVSIASLNVRGISSSTKFDTILEDLMRHSFSAVGLQETKIKESTGISLYKNFSKRSTNANLYKTYWNFDPSDASAGVGLIIASYISKYVQRIHCKNGRFIAIDLFLPAKKLKIINIYAHQAKNFASKGKGLTKFIMDHIKQAEGNNFQCIIMGDFNADPHKYHQLLEKGKPVPAFYQLVEFLTECNYIDQSPKDHLGKEFATFYASNSSHNMPTSCIDLIWYPDDMIRNIFCFDQIWQLPSTQLTTNTTACLDHRCIIVYFTKHLLLGQLPNHRVKQKGEQHTVFNFKACQQKDWEEYRKLVDERLQFNMANSAALTKSTLLVDKKSLNHKWQIFKDSILQAAKASLKTRKFGYKNRDDVPDKLITL